MTHTRGKSRIGHEVLVAAGAAGLCLLAALVLLALLAAHTHGETFAAALGDIGRVVWDKALLPGRSLDGRLNWHIWINSLVSATPILLTGLTVVVAFRASVLNIGGQGQFIAGAIAAAAVGIYCPGPAWLVLPLLMAAAMLGGAALAAIAAVLEGWRNVPVVLSTLLLNFVALEMLRYFLLGPLHEPGSQPQTREILEAARLPRLRLDGGLSHLHAGFFIALGAAAGVGLLLGRTTFGFRLRAVGENATAARFAAINVRGIALATLALSGALAGLAGGVELSGLPPHQLVLSSGSTPFGFTGIAVGLLGRLSPWGVILSAIFFGVLDSAFVALEREMGLPFVAAQAAQGAILICVLVATQPQWRGRLAAALARRGRQKSGTIAG